MNDTWGPANAYIKSIGNWQKTFFSAGNKDKAARVRGFREEYHPPEVQEKKRAPLSPLTDVQRRQRKIISGIVTFGEDGELYVSAAGLPEIIPLKGSDYLYLDGDQIDISVVRRTGSFQQYVILGRRS